ncbi:MAG TPA: hypothetical protein VI408_06215 [Gaiellaceae bacterium]
MTTMTLIAVNGALGALVVAALVWALAGAIRTPRPTRAELGVVAGGHEAEAAEELAAA